MTGLIADKANAAGLKAGRGLARTLRGAALVLACLAQVAAAAQPDQLTCGLRNVEDMVALPGTPWIIGSGIGDRLFQRGALHLIYRPVASGMTVRLDLRPTLTAQAPYDRCPGPPDAALFSAHGLSLRALGGGRFNLYVVNHGGRETVEVFRVTAGAGRPAFRWIGCVPTPETVMSNAVAARADGGLVLSASAAADRPLPAFSQMASPAAQQFMTSAEGQKAMERGALLTWSREGGWKKVPGSELAGNNGIELSRDEKWIFANSWPGAATYRIALRPGAGRTQEIKLPFTPDNIRWGDNGKLVATGHNSTVAAVGTCVRDDDPHCAIDYQSAEIDPATLAVTPIFKGTGTYDFGTATIGLRVGNKLWLGAVRSNCIAAVNLAKTVR